MYPIQAIEMAPKKRRNVRLNIYNFIHQKYMENAPMKQQNRVLVNNTLFTTNPSLFERHQVG